MVLLFVCLTIHCLNLWANEQIPFGLQLSKDGQDAHIYIRDREKFDKF